MANFDDIANNQHMIDIANAIRAVTRTTGKMAIPEMPERLWDIQVVMTRDIICDFSGTSPVSLGIYDKAIKHLFIATPKTSADVVLLAKVEAELELAYDETTGELEVSFSKPLEKANAVNIEVVDLLLASTATSSGFLVNQAVGGSKAEEYDSTMSYEVGDTFIYSGSLGVTVVAHEAEEFSNIHNKLMANQVFDTDNQVYRDLEYFAEILVTKFDKQNVKNEHSEERDEVYSARYANETFAPLALAVAYYATKQSSTEALFTKEQPEPSPINTLSKMTTNTDYDWTSPDFVLRRVTEEGVTINKSNMFRISLPFRVSRESNISWGARVKVSQDNGQTWSYVSSAQAYGAQTFETGVGNTYVFNITFDLLPEITTYEPGAIFEIEVFKKQALAAELTTLVYCGVEEDGAILNTTAELVVANIAIDTTQIKDGAVTYQKLSSDVQQKINTEDILTYVDDNIATREKVLNEESHTIQTTDWQDLSSSEPYKFSATITATYTIGNDTEVGTINDQPVLFGNYGFVVGALNGQSVTIYAVKKPEISVTLLIGFRG